VEIQPEEPSFSLEKHMISELFSADFPHHLVQGLRFQHWHHYRLTCLRSEILKIKRAFFGKKVFFPRFARENSFEIWNIPIDFKDIYRSLKFLIKVDFTNYKYNIKHF